MTTHVDLLTADEAERHASPVEDAGIGTLDTPRGNLPLDTLDLRATITGLGHRTELSQGFRNPFDEPLEATYIFPLPSRSAVTALRMEADGRVIDGLLKERGEARAEYDRALDAGQRASIAEQERPGVFTMRVGNILPGERVVVRLTLVGQLPYEDGEATFRFPLVVAPRYIPGLPLGGAPVGSGTAWDTDAVPDASRITPPVLLPGFPNPIRLSALVDIDAATLPLQSVKSSLHVTTAETTGERVRVRLEPGDRANRDFVLRLRFGANNAICTGLSVAPDAEGEGGTFALTVLPPTDAVAPRPRDLVLVLDRSGSMAGWKMVAARRAAARIVDTLGASDRFAVLTFDNSVESPTDGLVAATDLHRFRAVEHLSELAARGGTEMLAPLLTAADLLDAEASAAAEVPSRESLAPAERQRALVLITDGQVGNEDQILRSLVPRLGGVRVYTVGVDTAVNDAFLRQLALHGGGRCELVESEARLEEAVASIHRRISAPLITDLTLDGDALGIDARTVSPARLPDVFSGAPVVITGRVHNAAAAGTVTIRGRAAGGHAWQETAAAIVGADLSVAACWARARLRDLEDRYVTAANGHREQESLAALERELVSISLRFGVLCRFTAFVAVDSRVVTEGGVSRRVTQPVDLPDGWAPGQPGVAFGVAGMAAMSAAPMLAAPPMPPAPGMGAAAGPAFFATSARRARTRGIGGGVSLGDPLDERAERSEPAETEPHPLAAFAAEQLARMRSAAAGSEPKRRHLLAELAKALDAITPEVVNLLDSAGADADLLRTALHALTRELSTTAADSAEFERQWLFVMDALEILSDYAAGLPTTATRARQAPFWKR